MLSSYQPYTRGYDLRLGGKLDSGAQHVGRRVYLRDDGPEGVQTDQGRTETVLETLKTSDRLMQ